MIRALAPILVLGLAGCAASPLSRAGGGVGVLHVRAVDWNPGHAPIEGVRAVADAGGDVVAFADGAATVLSGGKVVAVDRSVPRWVSAGTLPAADGSGTWIVGVDGDGRVRRLFGKSSLELVSDRFGLGADHVVGVASLGGAVSGFRLQDEIAVADGAGVTRYATGPLASFTGGGGRAVLSGDPLRLFEVEGKRVSAFAVPDLSSAAGPGRAAFVAVSSAGKLFVATPEVIWGEDERGDLRVRFEAPGMTIHGLAAAGDRIWFAEGAELGVVEGGRVLETQGARVSPAATLSGSPSGDVWTLTGGALARYAVAADADWDELVSPVFHRVCEGCHRPGGEAGVVLATREAWEKRRPLIQRRVLVDWDMPCRRGERPQRGVDRAAIRAWVERRRLDPAPEQASPAPARPDRPGFVAASWRGSLRESDVDRRAEGAHARGVLRRDLEPDGDERGQAADEDPRVAGRLVGDERLPGVERVADEVGPLGVRLVLGRHEEGRVDDEEDLARHGGRLGREREVVAGVGGGLLETGCRDIGGRLVGVGRAELAGVQAERPEGAPEDLDLDGACGAAWPCWSSSLLASETSVICF